MIDNIKNADTIILANPRILEDEQFPVVKDIYRNHYRNKRRNYYSSRHEHLSQGLQDEILGYKWKNEQLCRKKSWFMRKIIFLDIDGVLNTRDWHCRMTKDTTHDEFGFAFDPITVSNLANIIDETGAVIVISSSWKFYGVAKLRKMWSLDSRIFVPTKMLL